jgi:hypothetical protein
MREAILVHANPTLHDGASLGSEQLETDLIRFGGLDAYFLVQCDRWIERQIGACILLLYSHAPP